MTLGSSQSPFDRTLSRSIRRSGLERSECDLPATGWHELPRGHALNGLAHPKHRFLVVVLSPNTLEVYTGKTEQTPKLPSTLVRETKTARSGVDEIVLLRIHAKLAPNVAI